MTEESTNFYATNFDLGSIPPLFVYQLSRSRWRIDTQFFQTLTTDCHLKHPAVHQSTALVVLTMIRVLAYGLSLVFYHRQIRSHARSHCQGFHEFAQAHGLLVRGSFRQHQLTLSPCSRMCLQFFHGRRFRTPQTPYSFQAEKSTPQRSFSAICAPPEVTTTPPFPSKLHNPHQISCMANGEIPRYGIAALSASPLDNLGRA